MRGAIEEAIDRCIKEGILRDFLTARRSEVVKVMTLDYTFDRRLELEREESRAEGMAVGRREGKIESLLYLLERIGTVPEETKQTIQSVTDMGVLESWLGLAVRAESMEEFMRGMTGRDS